MLQPLSHVGKSVTYLNISNHIINRTNTSVENYTGPVIADTGSCYVYQLGTPGTDTSTDQYTKVCDW